MNIAKSVKAVTPQENKHHTIKPCTISGFNIEGNHCFSYNIKNNFTLRIKVINENDSMKEFDVSELFTTEKEAQERIDKIKEFK